MTEHRPATPPSFLAQVASHRRARICASNGAAARSSTPRCSWPRLIVLIFAFAFISGADIHPAPGVIAGILWVSVLFSGTVALGRTFDRERENEAIRSLLLSPVPRPAIYLGKLIATATLMALVQMVVVPLCGLLFSADLGRAPLHLALTLLLGTLGFAAVGVVLSAALLRARSRDTLLASLLYPVVVPVFLAGAQATSQLLDPGLA